MRFFCHLAASVLVLSFFGCGGGDEPGSTFKPTGGGFTTGGVGGEGAGALVVVDSLNNEVGPLVGPSHVAIQLKDLVLRDCGADLVGAQVR